MASRQQATVADFSRQRQQEGLRWSLEALQKQFEVPMGKAVSNLLKQDERLRNFQQVKRQERQQLEAEKRAAPRQMTADDTEALITSLRKGEAPELGPEPVKAIDENLATIARGLKAAEVGVGVTVREIQRELATSGYLQKLAQAYRKVKRWKPKANTSWAEVQEHNGALEHFVEYATGILIAVESMQYGEVTAQEQKALRQALKSYPDSLPSLADIRQDTRSRIDATPLAQDIERRAAEKEQDRERNAAEAAEAAKHRVGVKEDSAAQAQPEEAEQAAELEEATA